MSIGLFWILAQSRRAPLNGSENRSCWFSVTLGIMLLAHKFWGKRDSRPVIILHGLLGSSQNWSGIGRALERSFAVFAVDLRNHGNSPHVKGMSFSAMAKDVKTFMEEQGLVRATLIGHSLGGKVAMRFAMDYPDCVENLIIVDIAPKAYQLHHAKAFRAMNALNLDTIQSLREADLFLQEWVPDVAMRQFLLTNLKRQKGGFEWRIHLKELTTHLSDICKNPLLPKEDFTGATLYIAGGRSNYVSAHDRHVIVSHFPDAKISWIDLAGHNPHVECKDAFVDEITEFMLSNH